MHIDLWKHPLESGTLSWARLLGNLGWPQLSADLILLGDYLLSYLVLWKDDLEHLMNDDSAG
jgi:hypothetical protein